MGDYTYYQLKDFNVCIGIGFTNRGKWAISKGEKMMQVSRREGETDWVLGFKFVSERDEGMYECQVSNTNVFIRK